MRWGPWINVEDGTPEVGQYIQMRVGPYPHPDEADKVIEGFVIHAFDGCIGTVPAYPELEDYFWLRFRVRFDDGDLSEFERRRETEDV